MYVLSLLILDVFSDYYESQLLRAVDASTSVRDFHSKKMPRAVIKLRAKILPHYHLNSEEIFDSSSRTHYLKL